MMNLNRSRILLSALLCLFACLFLFAVGRREQKAQMSCYTLTYSPSTDEEKSQADENYAIMCRRVSSLVGDARCSRTADGGFEVTVDGQLGGCSDMWTLKWLLFGDAVNTVIYDNDDYTVLARGDDVTALVFCEDAAGSYLEFHVTADAGTRISEAFAENRDLTGYVSTHSYDRDIVCYDEYSLSSGEDPTVWRCYTEPEDTDELKVIAGIWSSGSLSADLKSSISSYVTWLDPQKDPVCGENQILLSENPDAFPADYTRLYYYASRRHTKDEQEYLLTSTEAKLDTMGVPYALGFDSAGLFVIAVPAVDTIEQMASQLCSDYGFYLQTGTSQIYLTLDNLMIDADGITVLLDTSDAETLEQDLGTDSSQPLCLTLDSAGTIELARTDDTIQTGAFMITFDQLPEDAPWMADFLSAVAQYNTSAGYWTYSWIS